MADTRYKLIPLEKTQSIPIHWEFSQDDYKKLAEGHRSNWSVFLRDNVVHFCRFGGEEFYRFKLEQLSKAMYATSNLDTYVTDEFNQAAVASGWTQSQIEGKRADFEKSALEEVSGLLSTYFDITVDIHAETK